jgi:hypothetical protein
METGYVLQIGKTSKQFMFSVERGSLQAGSLAPYDYTLITFSGSARENPAYFKYEKP